MSPHFSLLIAALLLLGCTATPEPYRPGSCVNGAKDGDELDVDCGGPCLPCGDGKACAAQADCASGVCQSGSCQAPACTDGVKNGGELDVDCGGPCALCGAGKACQDGAGCTTGLCRAGRCQPSSCTDGLKGGRESDADCGGPDCPACAVGRGCSVAGDCTSAVCTGGKCLEATCTDRVKNGRETDVDCGGSCPAGGARRARTPPAGCAPGRCQGRRGPDARCHDGAKDGKTGGDPVAKVSAKKGRETLTIELVGGVRYMGEDRYYLIDRKEPPTSLAAVEKKIATATSSLEVEILLGKDEDRTVGPGHDAVKALRELADQHKIPSRIKQEAENDKDKES